MVKKDALEYNRKLDAINLAKLGYTVESAMRVVGFTAKEFKDWFTPFTPDPFEEKIYQKRIKKLEEECEKRIDKLPESNNINEEIDKIIADFKKKKENIKQPYKKLQKGEFREFAETYYYYYRKAVVNHGNKLNNDGSVTSVMKLIELGTIKIYKDDTIENRSDSRRTNKDKINKEKNKKKMLDL